MKLIAQIIALLLISINSLQVLLTIGTAVMLLKFLVEKFKTSSDSWMIRKKKRTLDGNMWAIE